MYKELEPVARLLLCTHRHTLEHMPTPINTQRPPRPHAPGHTHTDTHTPHGTRLTSLCSWGSPASSRVTLFLASIILRFNKLRSVGSF